MKNKIMVLVACLVCGGCCFNASASKKGIDSNSVMSYKDDTELHLAIRNGDVKKTLELVKYELFKPNEVGWYPIHELVSSKAIKSEDQKNILDVMLVLYKALGINVDSVKTDKGQTALFLGLANQNFDIVKYLIENGSDVKQEFLKGSNILMLAARFGANNEFLTWLQGITGIDVRCMNKDNWTMIHFAAVGDNVEAIDFYLQKGGKISSKQKNLQTALHIAAYHNNIDAVKFLIENGIDINIEDNSGRLAEDLGNSQIKEIIQNFRKAMKK